jgi:hypothetical protein
MIIPVFKGMTPHHGGILMPIRADITGGSVSHPLPQGLQPLKVANYVGGITQDRFIKKDPPNINHEYKQFMSSSGVVTKKDGSGEQNGTLATLLKEVSVPLKMGKGLAKKRNNIKFNPF